MKIQAIQALSQKPSVISDNLIQKPSNNIDFKTMLEGLKNFVSKDQIDIKAIEAQFANSNSFNPKELLSIQYRISKQHVRVELVAKVVESVLATGKRLQQVQ
jgi:hypothetical protein